MLNSGSIDSVLVMQYLRGRDYTYGHLWTLLILKPHYFFIHVYVKLDIFIHIYLLMNFFHLLDVSIFKRGVLNSSTRLTFLPSIFVYVSKCHYFVLTCK